MNKKITKYIFTSILSLIFLSHTLYATPIIDTFKENATWLSGSEIHKLNASSRDLVHLMAIMTIGERLLEESVFNDEEQQQKDELLKIYKKVAKKEVFKTKAGRQCKRIYLRVLDAANTSQKNISKVDTLFDSGSFIKMVGNLPAMMLSNGISNKWNEYFNKHFETLKEEAKLDMMVDWTAYEQEMARYSQNLVEKMIKQAEKQGLAVEFLIQ